MDIYKGVIQETTHCEGEHVSTMFIHPKKDNTYNVCSLNLKTLMSMCSTISRWILCNLKRNGYRALVDLKDPYYSVPIDDKY